MAKVMIADDSRLQRQMVGDILKSQGYEVVEAVDGKDAIEKLGNELPDCLVLDLLMPEVDGFEVLESIRDDELNVPVVVFSADIQDTTKERCFALGARSFVNKPIKGDELLIEVGKVLP